MGTWPSRFGGISNQRQKNVVMNPTGLRPQNDCAGDDQQHERMLHKDYNRMCVQLENKITGRKSQEACCQKELSGSKPPVAK
jgi:hypothetical protein